MAASKTTLGQVLSQIAAGTVVGGILWYSIRKKENTKDRIDIDIDRVHRISNDIRSDTSNKEAKRIEEALQQEIRQNTSGKIWGLGRETSSEKK